MPSNIYRTFKVNDNKSSIVAVVNKLNRASKLRSFPNYNNTTAYVGAIEQMNRLQNIAFYHGFKIDTIKCPEHVIPNLLYFHGSLVFFKDKFGDIVFTPYTVTNWDYNGQPLTVQPIPIFTTNKIAQKELIVNKECVLLHSFPPTYSDNKCIPYIATVQVFIEQMAEVFNRLNINITLAGDKLIVNLENMENKDDYIESLQEMFSSNSPFIVTQSVIASEHGVQSFNTKFDELTALLKEYDIFRQNLQGFGEGNYGNHKQERLVQSEIKQNSESVDLVKIARYSCLEDFKQQMQETFQVNVEYDKGVFNERRNNEDDARTEQFVERTNEQIDNTSTRNG